MFFPRRKTAESRKVIRIQVGLVKVRCQSTIFCGEAIVAKHRHALPYRIAVTAGLVFCQHHRRAFSILRHRSRWQNIGYPLTLCEDLAHHATSLRSSTPRGLGAWIASALLRTALVPHRTALVTANTGAPGR